jgi:hypothetical protein
VDIRVFSAMMSSSPLFLALLLLVHVYGDGEAFPESWVADAGHCCCCCLGDLILVDLVCCCDCWIFVLCANNLLSSLSRGHRQEMLCGAVVVRLCSSEAGSGMLSVIGRAGKWCWVARDGMMRS